MATTYKRPGVYVEESLNPSTAISGPALSTAAFVGATWAGPTGAQLVTSWSDFQKRFGGFPPDATRFSWLPYSVYAFFNNGGRECWISRATGTGAVVSALTLMDRAATPQATATIKALGVGTYGNSIYVQIQDRDISGGRFDLVIRAGGPTDNYIVERWIDMSMNTTDARYAPNIVNSSLRGSQYILFTDLNSPTGAPSDTPKVIASTAMFGGTDGAVPSAAQILVAINLLDTVEGPLGLNLPGDYNTVNISAAVTYAENRGDIFVVADTQSGKTPAEVIAFAGTLAASSYCAVYYPWLWSIDPSSATVGALMLTPPGGFVLGQYAATDAARGVWKAPAGLQTHLAGIAGVETKFSTNDLDTLNTSHVNAIRQITGAGTVIMGARTLKTTQADRYVPIRRTLIYLKLALLSGTRWAIFEPITNITMSGLQTSISQFLLGVWHQGGLRGLSPEQAFYVLCDNSNNPLNTMENGEIHVEVGVALEYPAEFVVIRIGQWEGGQSATVAV